MVKNVSIDWSINIQNPNPIELNAYKWRVRRSLKSLILKTAANGDTVTPRDPFNRKVLYFNFCAFKWPCVLYTTGMSQNIQEVSEPKVMMVTFVFVVMPPIKR